MAAYIKARPATEMVISWIADADTHTSALTTMEVTVPDSLGNENVEGRVGIGPYFVYTPIGPLKAFKESISATIFITEQMFNIIWRLVSQQESLKSLGGPVMIAKQAGAAARQGFLSLLSLAAFLSINLGILNILPIPVLDGGHLVFLDGGHLVFLTIEGFKRKPVSIKGRLIAQQIGMGLLLLLMVVVTYNDIARLVTGILD